MPLAALKSGNQRYVSHPELCTIDLAQQRMDGIVPAEERVQAALDPVAVAVAPRGKLAAGDRAPLDDDCGFARFGEKFGRRQAGGAGSDDQDIGISSCDQRTNSRLPAGVQTVCGMTPALTSSSKM